MAVGVLQVAIKVEFQSMAWALHEISETALEVLIPHRW